MNLFNSHKIVKREFNDIFYFNAKRLIDNNVDSILIKLKINNIKDEIENCKLVLSVESPDEFKFKKVIDITKNGVISEYIKIPKNTLATDKIKAYIWQRNDNKFSFELTDVRLFFIYPPEL